jgi:hypothetical protein
MPVLSFVRIAGFVPPVEPTVSFLHLPSRHRIVI